MNKKFAVVLSGCGVFDGTEIQEAVMTLYAIKKLGGEYTLFAPDMNQYHVVNHLTGTESEEKRNVFTESARIARGKIIPLEEFQSSDFDALIFPGGFGAAKNLSNFAFRGADCDVVDSVEDAINQMHQSHKPIGALCIAPVLLAKVIKGANVTIGNSKKTANSISEMKGVHTATNQTEIVIDKENKLVTSPCYMLDADIVQIQISAENVINAILELI